MRPIWKGAISFGLVTIPVGLYSATEDHRPKFRQLRRSDHSPIKYKRVAEADGAEVPYEEIIKGYEVDKGRYVVFTPEELEAVMSGGTATRSTWSSSSSRETSTPSTTGRPITWRPRRPG